MTISTSTPDPFLMEDLLTADHPAGLEAALHAADLATVDAVLAVLEIERQESARVAAAWQGLMTEAGPHFREGDTFAAVLPRMPEEAQARVREHVRVLAAAGVIQTGPEA